MTAIRTDKQSGTPSAQERAAARKAAFEQAEKAKVEAATERRKANGTGEFAKTEKPAKGKKKEVAPEPVETEEQPVETEKPAEVEETPAEPQGEGDLGV